MRRMNGLDAFMVHMDVKNSFQNTLKIAIYDPSELGDQWSFDNFREGMAAISNSIPMLRWRYLKVPFGLHHPVWVEDPDFELEYHVHKIACPAPGNDKALCELIEQLYILPLDQSRPLWMAWIVEGLEGGKFASILVLHHAYADGAGLIEMMHKVMKHQPSEFADAAPRPAVPPLPGKSKLMWDAVCELPGTLVKTIPNVIRGIRLSKELSRRYEMEGKKAAPNPTQGMRDSPINELVSACRSYAFQTYDLALVRRISKKMDVTINDLFVACAAATYRRFLIGRGYNADSGPLLTGIPFTQRPEVLFDDGIGNMTTLDYLEMPVHLADPLERLNASKIAGAIMKEHYREAAGADMNSILEMMPGFMLKLVNRRVIRKGGKFSFVGNATISNVQGPKEALYLGPLKLDNWISVGQVTHGMAVNLTVWSYNGKFNLSILADKKVLPNVWALMNCFTDALQQYAELTQEDNLQAIHA